MTEQVIVEMHTITLYDFLRDGETEQQGIERGNKFYKENLALVQGHLEKYGDYWKNRVEEYTKKVNAGCKVMTFDEYQALEKSRLITGVLTEVTAEQFDDMLNVLPPLYWTTINGVEMFCMREMYTGTYTTQYARIGDKHYCTMVDVTDKSTWINNLL